MFASNAVKYVKAKQSAKKLTIDKIGTTQIE
jgi:hypothetical protein